jgi:hypothetical protein
MHKAGGPGQPRPPSATSYRIISAVGSCCEPASIARGLLLISQMLELIAAWRSHGRCCHAAVQQSDELSLPARDVRQLSHAFPSTWCFLCYLGVGDYNE